MKTTPELIKHEKLTPTMERCRSGSTMLFREPREGDRSFISEDNADVILTHQNKAMYAKLIDGQWYWVNGCCKCDPSESPYILCKEHDRCDCCGIPRSELKEIPWGLGGGGFRCKPCQAKRDGEEKQAALTRVAKKVEEEGRYDEGEYTHQEKVKCPHCASEFQPDYDQRFDDGDEAHACDVCGGLYTVEPYYEVTYTTRVIGERLLPSSVGTAL